MFEGSLVALATPWKNGSVDLAKVEDLVKWHIEKGTNGIVPCGTTGESAVLSLEERKSLVASALKVAKGKVPVVVGTGTNNTALSIEYTKLAKDQGADGALLVSPYYNKPPQEGLFRHYATIAKAVDIPQVLYNVPSRTGVNILPETVKRLAEIKNIVAIKDATGDLEQLTRQRNLTDLTVLSGDDSMTYPMMCLGAKGVISVAANIIPAEVSELCAKKSRDLHQKFHALFKGLFIETNPIPVKAAMAMMKLIDSGDPRLPLCPISEDGKKKLTALLTSFGLL